MEDETAITANPNELSTELTAEQEQALINETLGLVTQSDDTSNDDAKDDVEGVEDKPKVEQEEVKEQEEKKQETPPAKQDDTTDKKDDKDEQPTAPKTDDLFIEIDRIITDDMGDEKVERVKLTFDPKNPDSFVPEDFKFKNDHQMFKALEAKGEMARIFKDRQSEYDGKLKEISEKESLQNAQKEILAAWDTEIDDLITAGKLDKPQLKKDDPKYRDDAAVRRIDDVFNFMTEQNKQRAEKNAAPIKSFASAYALFEKQENEKKAEDDKKKEVEDTKRKGSMIGGGSSSSGNGKKPYVAGSYSSIHEIPID